MKEIRRMKKKGIVHLVQSHSSIQIPQRGSVISRGEQGDFHLDQAYSPVTMYNKGREYSGILAVRK